MTIKRRIAHALHAVLPAQLYRELETRHGRRAAVRWLRQVGVLELALKVADHFDYTVQAGPFRGMRYTREAVLTHHVTPNLLGTYERQLYPLLEEAANRCDLIVDIGSAEGYFAVGLARMTGKPVFAFDVNSMERQMVSEMAALNDVSHSLTICGWCSESTLVDLVRGKRALVFCDIDGGEFSLFTPTVVKALRDCDVFVELHGSPKENLSLIEGFVGREPIVVNHPKDPAGAERLALLGQDAARMSTEYRGFQQWLVLRPSTLASLESLGENLRNPTFALDRDPVALK